MCIGTVDAALKFGLNLDALITSHVVSHASITSRSNFFNRKLELLLEPSCLDLFLTTPVLSSSTKPLIQHHPCSHNTPTQHPGLLVNKHLFRLHAHLHNDQTKMMMMTKTVTIMEMVMRAARKKIPGENENKAVTCSETR
jgi:hypothetical protein